MVVRVALQIQVTPVFLVEAIGIQLLLVDSLVALQSRAAQDPKVVVVGDDEVVLADLDAFDLLKEAGFTL